MKGINTVTVTSVEALFEISATVVVVSDRAMLQNYRKSLLGIFRNILLLLWKNLILRKRHYFVTTCEIILPIVFSVLISFARTQLDDGDITVYPSRSERFLVELLTNQCEHSGICLIAYYPPTLSIIDELRSVLKTNSTNEFDWHNLSTREPGELMKLATGESERELLVAIIFSEDLNSISPSVSRISYDLRFKDYFNNTDKLIIPETIPGPNDGNEFLYHERGFTGLQILIDKILIKKLTRSTNIDQLTISTQGFPYPVSSRMPLHQFYSVLLPQFAAQSFIFAVPAIIGTVLCEKETGVKELMKMMGLPNWMHWVGWALNSLLAPLISATIIVILYVISYHSSQGRVGYIDPTLWWVVCFLYVVSGALFCFLISAFFQKPLVGTVSGILIWVVSYYSALYNIVIPLEEEYLQLTLTQKMLLSFLPHLGVHFALIIRSRFEATTDGAGWGEFWTPTSSVDSLSFGHICLMFVGSGLLYLFLAIYFENVIPTKYGVRKPWYYIFQFKRLAACSSTSTTPTRDSREYQNARIFTMNSSRQKVQRSVGFEHENPNLKIGIELKNLCKVFGSAKIAVDNISLKMFKDRITVIVGQNGAGKTTVMNLLTGLFPPTGGSALINGHNICTEMESIRKDLGVCPQQNMLFARLTVFEHFMFFARLKGLKYLEAKSKTDTLIQRLLLSEKAGALSMHLSGGEKRKLSLGCAVIGGSQILVLDEPTSGMDAKARRAVWDLLLEMRTGRTILLATQFMEEAEVLGDHVAILCDGKLQCCGSPMFLKKCYGDGYKLKLTLSNKFVDVRSILSTIQKHVPNAVIVEKFIPSDTIPEVWFNLPLNWNGSTVSVFPSLFSELTTRRRLLGVETVGLSYSTMDDVFNRVVGLFRGQSIANESITQHNQHSRENATANQRPKYMFPQRFWGLLIKRILSLVRKRFVCICLLVSPVVLAGIAILIGRGVLTPPSSSEALVMDLKAYKNPKTLYYSDNEIFKEMFKLSVSPHESLFVMDGNVTKQLLEIAAKDLLSFREEHIVAAKISEDGGVFHATAMYSSITPHASPLAVNLITNAALKTLGSNVTIQITNWPIYSALESPERMEEYPWQIPIVSSVFLSISMWLLPASFILFPAEERITKVKHLQLMTGTSPFCYWVSLFCCDFVFNLLAIGLMTACIPLLETYWTFSANNGLAIAFLILSVDAIGANIFSYLVSLFVDSATVGFSIISSIHIFSGLGFNVIIGYLDVSNSRHLINIFRWIFRLFPSYGSTSCALIYVRIALANRKCYFFPQEQLPELCLLKPIAKTAHLYECCENCHKFQESNITCFSPEPYLAWNDDSGNPMIGQELVYMGIIPIIYTIVLFSMEYGIFRKKIQGRRKNQFLKSSEVFDASVLAERDIVERAVFAGESDSQNLILHRLSKTYGKRVSASNISLQVKPGECFGLLGLNGAGKTTTLKMVTGDCTASAGDVFGIGNIALTRKRDAVLSRIGYCPQVNSLIGVLTGREMLELFCRLRGVSLGRIKFEVAKWLTNTGLSESADTQCRNYSGGMRRRLCTAVAMIGEPPIVVLDEPTSCVDPIARRQLWQIMRTATNSGQAIIMTSHSLEECEILCSRVAIMVAGELRSVGSVSHLKQKSSQSIGLTIKLKYLIPSDSTRQVKLDDKIKKCFQPCILKYQNQNVLQYALLHRYMTWSTIFKILERIKVSFPNYLDEYSVYETTLEQILISMSSENERGGQYFSKPVPVTQQNDPIWVHL